MDKALHKIRFLLHELESQSGLCALTPVERDVLYVIGSLCEQKPFVASQDILAHDLTSQISRPTIYRALNTLLSQNFIVKSDVADRGFFALPCSSGTPGTAPV